MTKFLLLLITLSTLNLFAESNLENLYNSAQIHCLNNSNYDVIARFRRDWKRGYAYLIEKNRTTENKKVVASMDIMRFTDEPKDTVLYRNAKSTWKLFLKDNTVERTTGHFQLIDGDKTLNLSLICDIIL